MASGETERDPRKRLLERQAELQELSGLTKEDRGTVELDQQSVGRLSRMDAMQRQAMAQAQERARSNELTKIEQALRRLEEGEYGWCVKCGEEIAKERLDADPAAAICINCAGRR